MSPIGAATPSQPISTIFSKSGKLTNLIIRTKFYTDGLMGFGLAGTRKSYVSEGKHGRP
jgi:hypothetical protein